MLAASQNAPQENPEPQSPLYRIGDVSRLTDTKPFVLRYWETEFPLLQPVKTPKGHRLYRREDVELILEIKRLLYEEGFTIAGARRHLAELRANGKGWSENASSTPVEGPNPASVPALVPPREAAEQLAFDGTERRASEVASRAELRDALRMARDELRAILTLLQSG